MTNTDYKMVLTFQIPPTKLLPSHYKKTPIKFKVPGTHTILNFQNFLFSKKQHRLLREPTQWKT